jgi:hypothetical protein
LNEDWGICCFIKSWHFRETVFEHFTCKVYVHEGWGPHSFTENQEHHCWCRGASAAWWSAKGKTIDRVSKDRQRDSRIAKILRSHNCRRDSYYADITKPFDVPELVNASAENERRLRDKWKPHIAEGHYGFNIGVCPAEWFSVIDEFLAYRSGIDPDFNIQQIKMKFGGIRVHVVVDRSRKLVGATPGGPGGEEMQECLQLQIKELEHALYSRCQRRREKCVNQPV